MAMAKQVHYHSPQSLLPRRKQSDTHRPTVTVTFPLAISTRLSHLEDRRLKSAASIRRYKSTSLPRLAQPSARPSETTTKSTTTQSSSLAKKTGSGGEASLLSVAEPREPAFDIGANEAEMQEMLSPEEEEERRVINDKCQKWLEGLPDRFSSMHVVQQVVHVDHR